MNAVMQSAAVAAQMDALRKAFIEAMRKLVFDISRDLQLAAEHLETYPMQVYIVARASETKYKDAGLSPDIFPEFSDKEYVHSTQKKLNQVLAASRSNLNPEQIEQSEMAVKGLTELPLLNEAIVAKSSLEQIQASEAEWRKVEGAKAVLEQSEILEYWG